VVAALLAIALQSPDLLCTNTVLRGVSSTKAAFTRYVLPKYPGNVGDARMNGPGSVQALPNGELWFAFPDGKGIGILNSGRFARCTVPGNPDPAQLLFDGTDIYVAGAKGRWSSGAWLEAITVTEIDVGNRRVLQRFDARANGSRNSSLLASTGRTCGYGTSALARMAHEQALLVKVNVPHPAGGSPPCLLYRLNRVWFLPVSRKDGSDLDSVAIQKDQFLFIMPDGKSRLVGRLPVGAGIGDFAVAQNGDIWFTVHYTSRIGNPNKAGNLGHLDGAGHLHVYRTPIGEFSSIAITKDGMLWVGDYYSESIIRVNPSQLNS
jgi:sugar lactone lactonase YvrE